MSKKSLIIPLREIKNEQVGGKASGLAQLLNCGLKVPEGFVIVPDDDPKQAINELREYYSLIGEGKVAVRSSALEEDSAEFSYAGQYKTFLNVEGIENVKKAVINCIESASLERVKKYSSNLSQKTESPVAVVVQQMIEPKISGVLFTLDPSTGEEKILVNAVYGLGEALVSGKSRPDLYVLDRGGKLVMQEISGNEPILSREKLDRLVNEALFAEKHLGKALDMEWAIDDKGEIHWLQARKITTLNTLTINELDTPSFSDHIYTRANVGEMLPGAVTPLSISVFAEAIDIGLKWMYQKVGVYPKSNNGRYVCNFYGHLFFDLTQMYEIARSILGTSKENFEINLIGRAVQETQIDPPIAFHRRFVNSVRYFRFVGGYKKSLKKLKKMASTFEISLVDDPVELYRDIDLKIPVLYDAYYQHYVVSSHSGVMNGALVSFIGGGKNYDEESLSKAAKLLTNIKNIESANILESLEKMAALIAENPNYKKSFTNLTPTEALKWIVSADSAIKELYTEFMERHGHRTIREAEFREKDWRSDPTKVITLLQSLVSSYDKRSVNNKQGSDPLNEIYKELKVKGINAKIFRWIYNNAKEGMQNREYSKSMVIKVHGEFRKAYSYLAKKLEDKGYLPESDLIYFLKHDELGKLIFDNDKKLVTRAQLRKKLFAQQQTLQFPELTKGKPQPILFNDVDSKSIKELRGTPVSKGIVKGRVHIVKSIRDAEKLKPGEIMVAPFTDIGWTPYYSLIVGLITEIGGSLSHGAIVAREYGLPFVSNISNATKIFHNGQEILLNGDEGKVVIIED